MTSLRFFAALWVVLYHLLENGSGTPLWRLSGLGFQGVSFFFVLSGFIMGHNYDLTRSWSARRIKAFQNARFARIYPAYVLSLVLMAPLALQGLGTMEGLVLAVVQLLFCLTLAQAWFPPFALGWNSPAWSLSSEAFFYHLFPRIGPWLWDASNSLKRSLGWIAGIWVAGIAVSAIPVWLGIPGYGDRNSYGLDASLSPFWSHAFMYNPILRVGEFLTGILSCRAIQLALMENPRWREKSNLLDSVALLGVGGGIAAAGAIPFSIMFGGGILAPCYALLIASLSMSSSWLSRMLEHPLLVELGECSYALYILHHPVAFWMVSLGFGVLQSRTWWPILYLAICLAASKATLVLVERPARSWIRKRFNRNSGTANLGAAVAWETSPGN